MSTEKGPVIDPFRQRQVPEVAGRFLAERDRHQRQTDMAWLGVLASQFNTHEIRLLDDLGHLSQHDHDLLQQIRKCHR
jgi:hypothetical protein